MTRRSLRRPVRAVRPRQVVAHARPACESEQMEKANTTESVSEVEHGASTYEAPRVARVPLEEGTVFTAAAIVSGQMPPQPTP